MTVTKRKQTLYAFLALIVVLAVSILLLRPFYGHVYYQRARGLLNADRPYFAERPSFVDEAAADLKKAIRLDPRNSGYHHRYGVLLVQRFYRHQEGIAEVEEAIRLSPWHHYYHFDLGMIYLVAGEGEKGLEEIKKASHLYPLNEDYHQWLRSIYIQMKKKDLVSYEERWIERIQSGGGQKGSP